MLNRHPGYETPKMKQREAFENEIAAFLATQTKKWEGRRILDCQSLS